MKELFQLLQQVTGKKLSRKEQRHWTQTVNHLIDDRVRLIQRYHESKQPLSFSQWLLLQEGEGNDPA